MGCTGSQGKSIRAYWALSLYQSILLFDHCKPMSSARASEARLNCCSQMHLPANMPPSRQLILQIHSHNRQRTDYEEDADLSWVAWEYGAGAPHPPPPCAASAHPLDPVSSPFASAPYPLIAPASSQVRQSCGWTVIRYSFKRNTAGQHRADKEMNTFMGKINSAARLCCWIRI